jgi:hypothetical protein
LKILRGLWNEDLFRVLEGFADLAHDDEVDVTSGALGVRHLGGTDVGCDTGYRSSRQPISGQRRKLAHRASKPDNVGKQSRDDLATGIRIKTQDAGINDSDTRSRDPSSKGGHAFIPSIKRVEDVT